MCMSFYNNVNVLLYGSDNQGTLCRCVGIVAVRLGDIPIRVLEFIDMIVPHRFVKSYWETAIEPPTKLAGHHFMGMFFFLSDGKSLINRALHLTRPTRLYI